MSTTRTRKRAAGQKRSAKRHSSTRRPKARQPKRRSSSTGLPGWGDLSAKKGLRMPRRAGRYLEQVSTGRFALFILALAAAFTCYVGHVHATQDLYARLQQARQENQRLHLKRNRLKGEFDRATGPSVIYERAPKLGLEEDIAYEATIRIDNK